MSDSKRGILTRPEVARPRPVSQNQGQRHARPGPQAKAENWKVNFLDKCHS